MTKNGKIGIIDYGMGNLRSVAKAVAHLGGPVFVSASPTRLAAADKLILPGVGAFGDAMQELHRRKLIPVIKQFAKQGKPLLGICLGLQLFFERSEESPSVPGISIWKGSVKRFTRLGLQSGQLKIPHMGWNEVTIRRSAPIVKSIPKKAYFYFVHSYYAVPDDRKLCCGETNYGVTFASALASDHIFAFQFHPEKSQRVGLKLLRNFISLKA